MCQVVPYSLDANRPRYLDISNVIDMLGLYLLVGYTKQNQNITDAVHPLDKT